MTWQSEILPLKSVLIKNPLAAFQNEDKIDQEWDKLNYLDRPDLQKSIEEYDRFKSILCENGVLIHELNGSNNTTLDSIYTRDVSITTNEGMILCNMGKSDRGSEPLDQKSYFESSGITIKGCIEAPGKLEGGDVAWIDESTLAVARGYRTNDEGIRQLKELVKDTCEEVIVFHSPHYKGPSDVFHLMSVYSPVDHDLAVVYSPLMPVSFREELIKRGTQLVEVPTEEFDSLGCNVLTIAPRICLMVKGNPVTKQLLENAGATVFEFDGNEICLKGSGGPTCLTRPLERS